MKTTKTLNLDSLNARLYAAAKRAGFESDLFFAQVEISRCAGQFVLDFEHEVEADACEGDRRINYIAIDRARTWLAAATA